MLDFLELSIWTRVFKKGRTGSDRQIQQLARDFNVRDPRKLFLAQREFPDGGTSQVRTLVVVVVVVVVVVAGFLQTRGIGDLDHSAVPEQPQRYVPLAGSPPPRECAGLYHPHHRSNSRAQQTAKFATG